MFTYLDNFAERPFNPEMGILGWIFFIGFLMIVAGLWASVLKMVTGE